MKLYSKFVTTTLIAFAFLGNSCKKKEKIVEVEKDVVVYQEPVYKWQRVKEFETHNCEYIKNAHRTGKGFIYFACNNYCASYDSVNNNFTFYNGSPRDQLLKPLITNSYFTTFYNVLDLNPTFNLPENPIDYESTLIYVKNLDSAFTNFYLGYPLFQGEVCGTDSTLLIVYNTGSYYNTYMGIKLKYPPNGLDYGYGSFITVKAFKKYFDPISYASNRLLGPIGNNLLFTMGNFKNYLLNANLDTVYINNTYSYNDIFTYKNTAYSFARSTSASGNCCQTCFVSSNDNGLTWQQLATGLNPDFEQMNVELVGDKLIAFSYTNQIFEITIANTNVSAKELDNDGLANKRIKAITMSNNRVFISTESGVFERPYGAFIDYKK